MKRTRILPFNLACALLVLLSVVTTFAASHSWLGNTSAFWTVGSNWTNGTPAGGDDLYFVSGGLNNRSNYNNFTSGFTFGKITISEGNQIGYVLAGNPITLMNGISASGTVLSIQPQLDLNINCGNPIQTWTSTRSLGVNGTVDLRAGTIVLNNTGGITFNGTVTDSSTSGVTGSLWKTNTGLLFFSAGSRVESPNFYDDGNSGYPLAISQGHLRFDGVATNRSISQFGEEFYTIDVETNYGPVLVDGTGDIDAMDIEGATLSPGDGAPGILHCRYLTFYGTLSVPVNGTNAGADYSQLATGNNPVWDGAFFGAGTGCPLSEPAILNLQFGYTPQIGDTYQIINGLSAGYFGGLNGDCMFETNGSVFGIDYSSSGVTVTKLWDTNSQYTLWTGSTNFAHRLWGETNNWLHGQVPAYNANLLFTPYQTRDPSACWPYAVTVPPLTNDYSFGGNFLSMMFTGSNYVMYGNSLVLPGGITNRIPYGTNTIYFTVDASQEGSLVVDDGGVLQLGGQIVGARTLHKQGGGELLLTGTSPSFAGTVSVEGGSVRADGSTTGGTFDVLAGTLTGGGTVDNVILDGGTLSPGPGPAVMRVQGYASLNSGVFQVELNGTTPGSGYDQVQVTQTIHIGNVQLDLRPTNNIALGTSFLVLTSGATNAISGTFAGLPEGAIVQAGGQYFTITYTGGTGNDVVITRLNPPATFSTITLSGSNAVQLSGTGGSNLTYGIQATTNLTTKNWVNIGTAPVDGTGHFSFTDTNLLLYPQRFFRLLAP